VDYGRANLLKVVGDEPSTWCHNEPPISYTYIQVEKNITACHLAALLATDEACHIMQLHSSREKQHHLPAT
jgi:hypothetical protein